MGESIFIEPIRRWLSSRGSRDKMDQNEPVNALTPEQQFAQLKGLQVEAPLPNTAVAPIAYDVGQAPSTYPSPNIDNPVICPTCGGSCAQDARFCPTCSMPITHDQIVLSNAGIAQPPTTGCMQCGQPCPEGYELCANCTQINKRIPDEQLSSPEIKRVSIGDGGLEYSEETESLTESVRVRSLNPESGEDEEPVQVRSVNRESNDNAEPPNVNMADSLRSIFSGQTSINPDTVAFLERYGTVGTQELLDELKTLHRALRR